MPRRRATRTVPRLAIAWDLDGDGAFDDATGPTAPFTPGVAGSYGVAVRVTDPAGASAVATATVVAQNVPPAVDAGGDVTVGTDGAFVRAGSFTDPGFDTFTATVDFGDGTGSQPLALDGKRLRPRPRLRRRHVDRQRLGVRRPRRLRPGRVQRDRATGPAEPAAGGARRLGEDDQRGRRPRHVGRHRRRWRRADLPGGHHPGPRHAHRHGAGAELQAGRRVRRHRHVHLHGVRRQGDLGTRRR